MISGDSELVIKQLRSRHTQERWNLIPYHSQAEKVLIQFEEIQIIHIRRIANVKIDASAG